MANTEIDRQTPSEIELLTCSAEVYLTSAGREAHLYELVGINVKDSDYTQAYGEFRKKAKRKNCEVVVDLRSTFIPGWAATYAPPAFCLTGTGLILKKNDP